MRHVSRNLKVALEWLFDRFNLDPKIEIRYIDTKHQLADIFDRRKFHTWWAEQSSLSVYHQPFQLSVLRSEFQFDQLHQNDGEKDARTGRRQQDRGKVKADDDEPGLLCLGKFFECEQSDCVEKPRDTQSTLSNRLVKSRKRDARDLNHDAPSRSQGWQKDAFLDVSTGNPVATEEDQEHLNYPEDSVGTGKLVAPGFPGNSGNSGIEGNDEEWPHNLHISTNHVLHMDKVFSIVRRRYGLSPTDRMKDPDVNTAIWGHIYVCHSSTYNSSKKITQKICDLPRIHPWSLWDSFFQVTERLITEQTEITGLTTIDWHQPMRRETTLFTDRAVQFATDKFYVFSDSVLCLGGISDEPVKAWESRIKWFLETCDVKDLNRIDGETGITELEILDEIQNMMTESMCEPEQFKGRIIFMSMYTDIDWTKWGHKRQLCCEC